LTLLKEPLAFFKALRDRLTAHRKSSYGLGPLNKLDMAAYFQGRLSHEVGDHEALEYESELGGTLGAMAAVDMAAKRQDVARERLHKALEIQGRAVAANHQNPTLHESLSNHLKNLIRVAHGLGDEAAAGDAQRVLYELADSDTTQKALDTRLDEVTKGGAPTDNEERVRLAYRAYYRGYLAASARLFADALEADSKLADDRQAQYRYNAACAAALAGRGLGRDESGLDATEKARLREQARLWLVAELDAWTRLLDSATPGQRAAIAQTMNHWRSVDPDLAGIRDEVELAKLPDVERKAWQLLWADVDALLEKARGG
jgi:hypothetical protein